MPYQFETTVEGVKQTHKIKIENVVVNPKLESARFAKPE
jgi:outer membrane lipoprotein-sorting protein